MTLFEIFSKYHSRLKKHDGIYGIEIEAETKEADDYPDGFLHDYHEIQTETHELLGVYENPMEYWKSVEDGSLRDFGIEYVLKEPQTFAGAINALKEFDTATKGIPFLQGTPSTSVHVHVNMMNQLPITLANFVTLWVLFENVLVEYCGEARRSNTFAPPVRIVEGAWVNYMKMFRQIEEGQPTAIKWGINNAKYSALNIAPLAYLGSVELRCMRGTTNTQEITEWLEIIDRLLTYSQTKGLTPKIIYGLYQQKEENYFFDIFGSLDYQIIRQNWESAIHRQEFYLAKLAMSVKDWSKFGQAYKNHGKDFDKAVEYAVSTYGWTKSEAEKIIIDDPALIKVYLDQIEATKVAFPTKTKIIKTKKIDWTVAQAQSPAYAIDDNF